MGHTKYTYVLMMNENFATKHYPVYKTHKICFDLEEKKNSKYLYCYI